MARNKPAPEKEVPLETPKARHDPSVQFMDAPQDLTKSILNLMGGFDNDKIDRISFEENPYLNNGYAGIYKAKTRLLPNDVLKRLAIQDDLVAAIANARSNMIAIFGRPQPDRFSFGFELQVNPGILNRLTQDQREDLNKRIDKVKKELLHCGKTSGWNQEEHLTLSQCFKMSAYDAVVVGKLAWEIVYVTDLQTNEKKFHSFRPMDAGTIYRAVPHSDQGAKVRKQAFRMLEKLKNEKLRPESFANDEYAWVQVIDGHPMQAFTSKECIVHNFYPVTNVDLQDSPVTPLDNVITAVTMHLNIGQHNRMFFQTGRAAKGMLVFQSNDMSPAQVAGIKQQFNASINGAVNSWRMPVFSVGQDDKITWQSIDSSGRDMEFQYLSDQNCRTIMSAFQMSPEELPGMSHLSRGSNSQALSEGNNEYLLIAHRDVGLRPLIHQFEDVVNERVMPLVDEVLAKMVTFKMVGLEAETAEKESIRIQQDMVIHMSYDDILAKVQKKPIGKHFGGEFPLNSSYLTILDKYHYVSDIREHFFGIEGASKDPDFQYVRDPFWFQWKSRNDQLQMGQTQNGDGGSGGPADGGPTPGAWGGGANNGMDPQIKEQQEQMVDPNLQDVNKSIDDTIAALSKAEQNLPAASRQLLNQQNATMAHIMHGFDQDAKKALADVFQTVQVMMPKIKKPKK